MPRKTKAEVRKELASARKSLAAINKIRKGAESAFKTNPTKTNAKGFTKAQTEWKNQYVRVKELEWRLVWSR